MRTENWDERFDLLDDFSMEYGVAVLPLFEADYLKEFYDFYEIRNRKPKLIPYGEDFHAAMRDMCGEPRGPLIAGKTEALFGLPKRIMAFDNDTKTVRFYEDRVETDSGTGKISAAPYASIRRESETEHMYILEFGKELPATAFDKDSFVRGSVGELRPFLTEARRRVYDDPEK